MLTSNYIDQKSQVKPGRFYILPELHKASNPGRPIVSSNGHPTFLNLLIFFLKPLVTKLPPQAITDFLNKLRNLPNTSSKTFLVTLDVSSFYTNMPHNDGINDRLVDCFFLLHRVDAIIVTFLLKLNATSFV